MGVRGRVMASEHSTVSAGVSPLDPPPAPGPRGPRGSILTSTPEHPFRAREPHPHTAAHGLGGTGGSPPRPLPGRRRSLPTGSGELSFTKYRHGRETGSPAQMFHFPERF